MIFTKEYFDVEHARIIYELKRECPTIWRGTFMVLQRGIDFVDDWLKAGGPPGAKIDHYFAETWQTEPIADFSVRY